jgi:hypothetical protein
MRVADDGGHVVLAVRLERNVAQQHDLVVAAHLVEGAGEVRHRVFVIAAEILAIGARDPARRVEQPLALGVSPAQAMRVRTASSTPPEWRHRAGRGSGQVVVDVHAARIAAGGGGCEPVFIAVLKQTPCA